MSDRDNASGAAGSPVSLLSREPVCPGCGLSARELRDNGRMGCARCYEMPALAPLVEAAARELHGVASPPAIVPPAPAVPTDLSLPWPTRRGAIRPR